MTDSSLAHKRKANNDPAPNESGSKKPRIEEVNQPQSEEVSRRKRKRVEEDSENKRRKYDDNLNCNELLREMKKLRERNRREGNKKVEEVQYPSYSELVKWINENRE